MRVLLFLMTAYAIIVTDAYSASPTPSKREPFIFDPRVDPGNHPAVPPEGPKNTSETHGSLSKPTIKYNLIDGNAMYITCFSKSGLLPIRYQLFLYNRMLEEKTVYRSEPADFTVPMTPLSGPQVYFNCTAISKTGEKSSDNLTIPVVMDDSAVVPEDPETDQKDKETGPEHLIPLQHILTSVTPEVLHWNTLVLITCGPIILLLLAIVIIITYLRSQKEQYTESILMDSRSS